ncbi:MAG TPA: glycine oxidase ThiO [Pyrinomonadaceae bacterium]
MNESGASVADVVVVGGGVIGLSVARSLALRGVKHVTLIERGRLGSEASSAAGGMLAPQAEANRADAFFELACASRELYPAFAEALREETGTDIELERTGTLYLAFSDEDEEEIERRHNWQRRAGLAVELLTGDEARLIEPCLAPQVRAALRFPLDVQVENRRLLVALAAAAENHGVRLLSETHVTSIISERGRIEGVETSGGPVRASAVVLACGAWTSFLAATDKSQATVSIEPVRGQMLCFEMRPRVARHVIYSPRGYIIPRLDGRLLAGSTSERAGFSCRVTAGGVRTILTHALEIAPTIESLPLVDSWAGLRPRTRDDWPVIGASLETQGLFYATGHYRNGILLAPLTGELVAEQITTGSMPPLLQSFSPERFSYARTS